MLQCFFFSTVRGARARPAEATGECTRRGVSCPRTQRGPDDLYFPPAKAAGRVVDMVPRARWALRG